MVVALLAWLLPFAVILWITFWVWYQLSSLTRERAEWKEALFCAAVSIWPTCVLIVVVLLFMVTIPGFQALWDEAERRMAIPPFFALAGSMAIFATAVTFAGRALYGRRHAETNPLNLPDATPDPDYVKRPQD